MNNELERRWKEIVADSFHYSGKCDENTMNLNQCCRLSQRRFEPEISQR
jgi:hypothetical protein